MKTLCVILVYVISAYFHLTHAYSNSQRYEGKARNGYTDSTVPYIENFGNGENKHNFVNINETPDRFSYSGTSFSKDNGEPSVQKVNVDFNKPNYRSEPQDPNIYYNPTATRTHISNIGNGEGNKNLFVFNDNRNDPPHSKNNQDDNNGYRGKPNYGHQRDTRIIANIGRGPGNNNMIYVQGERVYPNTGTPAPIPRNNQSGNNGYQGQSNYGHQDNARVITNIGRGPGNNNMFYANGERVYPNSGAPALDSRFNQDGNNGYQGQSNYGHEDDAKPITNIGRRPGNNNMFYGRIAPVSRNNQNDNNGHRGESNYARKDDAWITANIGNGVDNNNMIYVNNERVYPNAGTATNLHDMKATKAFSPVLSDVSQYANDFGNGYQNTNRILINTTDIINPNPVNNNINIPNKHQTYEAGTPAPIPRNNQGGNNGYQGQSNYGHQDNARVINNIGRGPGNNNMIYANGERVYPNSDNIHGAEDNRRIVHEPLPSDKNYGVTGKYPNYNEPIPVTRRPEYGGFTNHIEPVDLRSRTGNKEITYTPKTNFASTDYNQVKIMNSFFDTGFNDPSFKQLPMRD